MLASRKTTNYGEMIRQDIVPGLLHMV